VLSLLSRWLPRFHPSKPITLVGLPEFNQGREVVPIIFFDHFDPATGEELWVSSGGVTKLVKDINPGLSGSNPENLTVMDGTLFFTAYDDVNGYQLWKSNGTAAGTVRLTSLAPSQTSPSGLTDLNGTLLFFANDGIDGWQLWKSDGTAAGTAMLTAVNGSIGMTTFGPPTASGGKLFFSASDGVDGVQLWVSDGTAAGTRMLTSYIGTSQSYLTDVNGTLYFIFAHGNVSYTLMKSDGTVATTITGFGGVPAGLTSVNGTLFFTIGSQLWKSDGTFTGTVQITNVNVAGGGDLTAVGSTLYFVGTDGLHGEQIWKSDGTAAGTIMVTDVNSASQSGCSPSGLTDVNRTLYFLAYNGSFPYQLWKTDGTATGTTMVTNVTNVGLSNLTNVNGELYFEEYNGFSSQLWKTDGTAAGTVMVANNVDRSQPIAAMVGQLTQPTVTSVTASPQTGAFGVGQEIALTVGLSEAVTVSGAPTLLLNDGATASYDPIATAALKDPTKTVFDYTVGASQNAGKRWIATANTAIDRAMARNRRQP
jgi:ELWxxDGT repeat protein